MDQLIMLGVVAVSLVLNFVSIQYKISKGEGVNASVDIFVFFVMAYMFMGTMSGVAIASVASALFSIYLLIVPFKWGFKMPDLGLEELGKELNK